MKTKAGFVAIIGAPNAGKSTLLNSYMGQKIAIVSPKVQTTRVNMRGILTQDNCQFVFVDTPGIYRPKGTRLLDKSMVSAAWQASGDADVILLVVDAHRGFNSAVTDILDNVQDLPKKRPIFLALNKVDCINKETVLPLMQHAQEMGIFEHIFAISAKKGDGIADLLTHFAAHFPQSPYLYEEDTLTDMPMRLLAAEVTREKAFLALNQEIPYSLAVETITYETNDKGHVNIHQNILVERDGHKGIVLGKGGKTIKHIGEKSRRELQDVLQGKVNLFLNVKVSEKWAHSHSFMREIGLTSQTVS